MRAVAFAALAFLVGLVLGWGGALVGYVVVTIATGFQDRDGGAAMGVAFGLGPMAGLALGTLGAVIAVLRTRARAAERARGARPAARGVPRPLAVLGAALLGAVLGVVVGIISFWVILPQPLSHTLPAIGVELAPFVTGLLAAVAGGVLAARAR